MQMRYFSFLSFIFCSLLIILYSQIKKIICRNVQILIINYNYRWCQRQNSPTREHWHSTKLQDLSETKDYTNIISMVVMLSVLCYLSLLNFLPLLLKLLYCYYYLLLYYYLISSFPRLFWFVASYVGREKRKEDKLCTERGMILQSVDCPVVSHSCQYSLGD